MTTLTLYYATNRRHKGAEQFAPKGYGADFSRDGMDNLRFGVVSVEADQTSIDKHLTARQKDLGEGNGEKLSEYLTKCASNASIAAYPEDRDGLIAGDQNAKLGSAALFDSVRQRMLAASDVLLYVHGFNVKWTEAVGSALALQAMLQHHRSRDNAQNVIVVLFSWPSDGAAIPFASYKSDRNEATGSSAAFARGIMKTRDFLAGLRDRRNGASTPAAELCGQDIHLLTHSMGNYVLQKALAYMIKESPNTNLPRVFEHIFLCAPDVNENVLEPDQPLGRLPELARSITIYHNRNDTALVISDFTKGNPDRLGAHGAARPGFLHQKIHQVDCAPIVSGLVEHSYYLNGAVNEDIRFSIDGVAADAPRRLRDRVANYNNVWKMKPAS